MDDTLRRKQREAAAAFAESPPDDGPAEYTAPSQLLFSEILEVRFKQFGSSRSASRFGRHPLPFVSDSDERFRQEDERFEFLLDASPVLMRMKALLGNAVQLHSASKYTSNHTHTRALIDPNTTPRTDP